MRVKNYTKKDKLLMCDKNMKVVKGYLLKLLGNKSRKLQFHLNPTKEQCTL